MKATTIIIAAFLTLQAGILFAGNDNITAPAANETSMISLASLAPSTPLEATFEEIVTVNMADLMPSVPAEATFEDMTSEMNPPVDFAPVTPAVADFE